MPSNQRAIFQTSAPSSLRPAAPLLIQLLVFIFFVALSVMLSWPLATDAGRLLAGTNDPPLFSWILATVSQSLMSDPLSVFEGDIFYPYGSTVTFSEPLIFPALISGVPALAWTGNPILAYNVTLLLFQALSGWAAWYGASRISASAAGAMLAGIVFAFSAFKLGYYNFINIHMSFALPLAFVSAIAFFESLRWRYLFATVVVLWLQAGTIWYGAIPLGLVLGLLVVVYMLLRPGLWLAAMSVRLIVGAVLLAVLVAPIALPYFNTHEQMQFVRDLAEVNKFRADLLSFLDPGIHSYWGRRLDAGREPGLFVGFVCITLALLAWLICAGQVVLRAGGVVRWSLATLLAAVCFCLSALYLEATKVLALAPSSDAVASGAVGERVSWLIGALVALAWPFFLILGLSWRRARTTRSLRREEWVLVIGWFTLVGILLVLGPIIHVGDHAIARGLYALIYDYVPGFNGLRIAIRLAFVYLFFVGLLAAFAVRMIALKLPRRWTGLTWLLPALCLGELWPANITYQRFDWDQPPPVYQQLAALDDGVVLELPSFDEHYDSTYMLWALKHGKPIVNGVSGFYPPHIQKLATLTKSLPNRPVPDALERIHGLRYLVIHLDRIKHKPLVRQWLSLSRRPPRGFDFNGRYGDALLFELTRTPVPAWRWQRLVPAKIASVQSQLHFEIDASGAPQSEHTHRLSQRVQLLMNNQPIDSVDIRPGVNAIDIALPPIAATVHPVALELRHSYSITDGAASDPRYAVGRTGVFSPVDIVVESASRQHGALATIWVNGINQAARQPGYNVVLVDPASGERIGRAAFDVSKDPAQNRALANYITAAPAGSIVVVALKDRGLGELDATASATFALIGGGQLDTTTVAATGSHLIVGVRGAPPGSAVEIAKPELLRYTVGIDRRQLAMTVRKFELRPR